MGFIHVIKKFIVSEALMNNDNPFDLVRVTSTLFEPNNPHMRYTSIITTAEQGRIFSNRTNGIVNISSPR